MPGNRDSDQIYESIAAHCEPYRFSEPWAFQWPNEDVCRLPAKPEALLAELSKHFSKEALIDAGVAHTDNDGRLQLDSKLSTPGELLVILRDENDAIVDMLTEEGSVVGEDLPLFNAVAGRTLVLGSASEYREVVVAFTLEDVAVLRGCGIPTTLAVGVDRLHPRDVVRLCEAFGLEPPSSDRLDDLEPDDLDEDEEKQPLAAEHDRQPVRVMGPDGGTEENVYQGDREVDDRTAHHESRKLRLVFVNWSPATLSTESPAGITSVVNHFMELRRYMGLELSEICVWKPTVEGMHRVKFFMEYEDSYNLYTAMLDCIYNGMCGLEHLGDVEARQLAVPTDFPEAVLALRDAMLADAADRDVVQDRRDALRHVERLLQEQVIVPMLREAMESFDPTERTIGLAAAQVAQMFLTQAVMVNARVTETLSEQGIAGLEAMPVEEIKRMLEIGDRVSKMFKDLEQCRESTVNVIPVTAMPPERPRALGSSD